MLIIILNSIACVRLKRYLVQIVGIGGCVFLVACGQSGALYLPSPSTASVASSSVSPQMLDQAVLDADGNVRTEQQNQSQPDPEVLPQPMTAI